MGCLVFRELKCCVKWLLLLEELNMNRCLKSLVVVIVLSVFILLVFVVEEVKIGVLSWMGV